MTSFISDEAVGSEMLSSTFMTVSMISRKCFVERLPTAPPEGPPVCSAAVVVVVVVSDGTKDVECGREDGR